MKKTLTWALALIMALSMVVCLLPTTIAEAADAGETIYVATTGSDTTGDGSQAKPYATIQKAVNEVPAENTVPTTILIADGAYNVYVAAGDANDIKTSDSYGHGLVIAKSNLTLKAQNKQKVVIYGYTDAATSVHHDHNVLRIRNSENLTFDGLVILPLFAKTMSASSGKITVSASTCNDLLRSFLGAELEDLIVGDTSGNVMYYTGRPMIVTNGSGYGTVQSNGIKTTSGLTFKNCYLDCLSNKSGVIKLQNGDKEKGTITGDYHFIGNTFTGNLEIAGAGNDAKVNSEIRNNIFENKKIIALDDVKDKDGNILTALTKLPVIEGNTFKAPDGGAFEAGEEIISNKSKTAMYTAGELSVMCQKNELEQAETGRAKNIGVSTAVTSYQKIQAQQGAEDKTIDTEEELAYWLTQEGEHTLAADITLTKALPEDIPGILVLGDYTVTKDASLVSPAPEGYAWNNSTSLKVHTHVPATEWSSDEEYHWHVCTADDCLTKLDKAAHAPAEDDYDCTTADRCAACGIESSSAEAAHVYDNDCTTDDECQNEGCTVKAAKADAHTFTDDHDTTCNVPNCIGTQEMTHTPSADWKVDGDQHYHPCTYDGCTEKLNVAAHTSEDDGDCTTDVICAVCEAKTADGAAAHTFDNCHDTTCNVPGCAGTQEDSHDWSTEWASDGNNHWRACSGCDEKAEEAAHIGTAVCTAKANCEVCGVAFGEIDPDNHFLSDYMSNGDATCEEDGTKSAICEYGCGLEDTVADEGSALGHKYTKYTSNNDATCEQDGTKTAACDNGCGKKDTVTDEGSKLGHKYTKYTANNDATCEQDGTKTATCDNGCGTKDTVADEGTAKGHSYADKAWESDKDNHWKSCGCGEKFEVTAHTGKLVGAKEATEEAEGYTGDTVCEVCAYEIAKGEVVSMLKKPVNVVVIVIIVVAVAAVGVGAYLVIAKKKKQR